MTLAAYLATTAGGLDSVAVIAASTSQVDLHFALAFQSVRLLLVIGTRLVQRMGSPPQRPMGWDAVTESVDPSHQRASFAGRMKDCM
jgi:hypothetical protein